MDTLVPYYIIGLIILYIIVSIIFLKCKNIHDEIERSKYICERKMKHKGGYAAMRKKCKRTLRKLGIY